VRDRLSGGARFGVDSRGHTARWLIITRDSNIAVNRAEIAAVRDHNARMVALAGREAIGTWAQLEVLLTQWRRIEALLGEPGPFIYSATRTTFKPVDLT
jgi:PIN domain-containing protein